MTNWEALNTAPFCKQIEPTAIVAITMRLSDFLVSGSCYLAASLLSSCYRAAAWIRRSKT